MARLACFDLDNTLIDRDGAFLAWARWWADRAGLAPVAVDWLVAHDNHGFAPRSEVFAAFESRFGSRILIDACDREHPVHDIAGAHNAGLRTIHVTSGAPAAEADRHVPSVVAAFSLILDDQ